MWRSVLVLSVFLILKGLQTLPTGEREETEPEKEIEGSEYNEGLFEGDIAGSAEDLISRNGRLFTNYRWKYRTVHYLLSEAFSDEEQLKIHEGATEYRRKTCINLVHIKSAKDLPPWATDYLYITRESSGCWSYVGRLGTGRQQLNLGGSGCMSRGTIVHEIMHALGFWHEQSRPDRENYVTINETNVQNGKMNNFVLREWHETTTLDEPYDTESVMHYSAYAFANDTKVKTIISKNPTDVLGQRLDFSKIDITKINRLYGCT